MNVVITNTCSFFFLNLHDFLYENEYCEKTKKLTPGIFLYVLEKIFIVNLKIFSKILLHKCQSTKFQKFTGHSNITNFQSEYVDQ